MATRRTEEDILNPHRIFYDLIRDYQNGSLTTKSPYKRARVEAVDHEGGQLEANPPNPANSVRARVYTSGLDFNTPNAALTVFYPLNNPEPVAVGEHVLVVFEDDNYSSGYWISKLPANSNVNYSNPDDRQTTRSDSSHSFEGDSPQQRTPNIPLQYGGISTGMTRERRVLVETADRGQTDSWAQKKILLIGDSQVVGPFSTVLGNELREHNILSYIKQGRTGWGVSSWLSGRLRAGEALQPKLDALMRTNTPDVVIISLGGNDGTSGKAARADYETKVRELWAMATNGTDFAIWCGPPTAVGRGAAGQPGRNIAAQKIKNVVGDAHFVDPRQVTNVTTGRDRLGVHFVASSSALAPWAQLVVDKGLTL